MGLGNPGTCPPESSRCLGKRLVATGEFGNPFEPGGGGGVLGLGFFRAEAV